MGLFVLVVADVGVVSLVCGCSVLRVARGIEAGRGPERRRIGMSDRRGSTGAQPLATMPAFLLVDVLLADYVERRMNMGGMCECIRPCGCRKIMRGGDQ